MLTQIRDAIRTGSTAAWINGVIHGHVAPDDALSHVSGRLQWAVPESSGVLTHPEPKHLGTEDMTRLASWPEFWSWLRAQRDQRVHLHLPTTADTAGLVVSPKTAALLINAGAVLSYQGTDHAGVIIPKAQGSLWLVQPVGAHVRSGQLGTLPEARRQMREAMAQMARNFVGSGLPMSSHTTDLINQARSLHFGDAPICHAQLAEQAIRVWALAKIAGSLAPEGDQFRSLAADARLTLMLAINEPADDRGSAATSR